MFREFVEMKNKRLDGKLNEHKEMLDGKFATQQDTIFKSVDHGEYMSRKGPLTRC